MTEMEPIELTCPNCSTEFNSETLMSTNSFGGIQTDFRKTANGYPPRQFLIHGCPSCGFSGFDKDFKPKRGSLSTSVSKLVKEQLTPSTDEGASQEEIYYRTRAIEFFGKALDGGDVAIEHMPQITYLVGELYRRVGRQTEAAEWFERAEVLSATQPELNWLLKLVKQQRVDPQEYIHGYCRPLPLLEQFCNLIVL